ncbi:unnamed protein product [Zymoseptoria tritici ST99CH_1A5]|uniref:HTH CENPB-type domain-containing protein n=1 Tax=Zymoseptoria tritici ST99CH_1A5 TaxID=1276529 RepID=A0A1Y6LAK8_ZYMTR|nr:unnamed protein product [Zymoseptoria tritici ST99CH_1A5]
MAPIDKALDELIENNGKNVQEIADKHARGYATRITRFFHTNKNAPSSFVHDIAKVYPSRHWVPRFVRRHKDQINSRYLNPLDKSRKKADSARHYKAYYDLLKSKIKQYNIEPCNTYNMDEKGFLIGMLQKTKRVFTKEHLTSGRLIGNIQDGSRE